MDTETTWGCWGNMWNRGMGSINPSRVTIIIYKLCRQPFLTCTLADSWGRNVQIPICWSPFSVKPSKPSIERPISAGPTSSSATTWLGSRLEATPGLVSSTDGPSSRGSLIASEFSWPKTLGEVLDWAPKTRSWANCFPLSPGCPLMDIMSVKLYFLWNFRSNPWNHFTPVRMHKEKFLQRRKRPSK